MITVLELQCCTRSTPASPRNGFVPNIQDTTLAEAQVPQDQWFWGAQLGQVCWDFFECLEKVYLYRNLSGKCLEIVYLLDFFECLEGLLGFF